MCGITGLLCPPDSDISQTRWIAARMTAALAHRGPDAEGIWTDGSAALGHRRLSILDLSEAGAQPLHSTCGRFVIVFNGEVYNHLNLRRDIEETGVAVNWRGHSDTETLLAGVVQWGLDETLKRAAGMFALALWDRKEKRLSLARDRIGEKPLYWGWAGRTLIYGSELKALRCHPGFPKNICREALAQYLSFAYVPAPRSIHPGIYKLEPGCILEVNGTPPLSPPHQPLRPEETFGSLSIRRYWSLNETIEAGSRSNFATETEAVSTLENTLSEAVGRQMISDVPLGAFLSGGIDSSVIVALMQAQSSRAVRTFTVGFENAAFNEAPHAAAVAKHLGTDHTEIIVTENEARNVIPLLPELYDEPFADSSQIPTHLVCRAAREHVTVALSGDAGDELFGGYNRYIWGPSIWRRLRGTPAPLRRALGRVISVVPSSAWDRVGTLGKGRFAVSRAGEKAHKLASGLRTIESVDDLYQSLVSAWPGDTLVKGLQGAPSSILNDDLPDFLKADPAARMMVQDMRSYLPDDGSCQQRCPFFHAACFKLIDSLMCSFGGFNQTSVMGCQLRVARLFQRFGMSRLACSYT